MSEIFAKHLKEERESKGYTQQQLADLLGLTNVAISGYERNTREPDLDTLDKIAGLLNVSTDYLLGRSDIRNPFGQMTIAAHKTDPFADLSPVNIEKINSFIKFIRNENNEKK